MEKEKEKKKEKKEKQAPGVLPTLFSVSLSTQLRHWYTTNSGYALYIFIRVDQSHQLQNINVLSGNRIENCVTWAMLNMTPVVLPTRMIIVFIGTYSNSLSHNILANNEKAITSNI